MNIPTAVRRIALIAALALVPVLPYAALSYAGQDLPFHVCSWLDLRDGWANGHFTPGWSAAANFGLGDPHLTFYPPVSFVFGALLTLILPLKLAPAAFAWSALFLSGCAMYAASRRFVSEQDRLPAALLYMLGPYTVTTSLVRFAAAELLVQAWLPLIALCFYEAVRIPGAASREDTRASRRGLVLLALLLGLSWITNIPASIVLLYSLAIAALLCAWLQRSPFPVLRFVMAELLAGSLAAFHLAPAWREQSWIQPATLLRLDPRQLLLFMPHYTFHDSPLIVVCWIFLCVEAALAFACLRKRILPLAADPAVPLWAALAAASLLMQSPLAVPLWKHAPELRFVQFPFRFLAIIGAALPLMLLSRGTRRSLRRPAYVLLALLSTTPFIAFLSEQAIASNRKPPLPELLASWHRRGAPEYLPAGTLQPFGPADMPAVFPIDASKSGAPDLACDAGLEQQSPNLRILHTESPDACRLRLALYFYPYWRASDESHRSLPVARDSTGLLVVDVPSGSHTVSLVFRPASPTRTASRIFSLAALSSAFVALWVLRVRPRFGPDPSTSAQGHTVS